MPLVRCPGCKSPTPSSSVRCMHCGGLAPACAACGGSGVCPDCATADAHGLTLGECPRCGDTKTCPGCAGQKRHWPAAAPA